MGKYSLRRISADEFVKRLRRAETSTAGDSVADKRYAFFLGAGCSVSSGIPPAGRLVRDSDAEEDWLRRYRDVNEHKIADEELDDWAKREFRTWSKNSPASSYGELIERLFITPGERQREIERLCHGKVPNFGYAVLSALMPRPGGHFGVVLTTNFDDLLAEAFFRFGAERLMVINHDLLAPFIRPTHTRPLLVKLHGDHRLSPRNTGNETATLDKFVSERVAAVLHDRGLIFLGYGGNDESILRMLEDLPDEALPFGVYWVSRDEPRGIFRRWLEKRDAVWVEHQDFDDLMLKFKREFLIEAPSISHAQTAIDQYFKTEADLINKLDREKSTDPAVSADSEWIRAVQKIRAALRQEKDHPDLADQLYREAVELCPEDPRALGSYALFLRKQQRPDEAQAYYQRAIDTDPKHAINLGNFANFLKDQKRVDEAEKYYKLAIDAAPKDAAILGNFANFLTDAQGRHNEAEKYYRLAIDADSKNANNLGNFAIFLKDQKRFDEAEKWYRLAVEADPQHTNNLGSFAGFLKDRKQFEEAEKYFKLAIDAGPENANKLGNFANLLRVQKRLDEAEKYYKLAIDADPKNVHNLGNFASFLKDQKRLDEAEKYYRLATDADPKEANNLGNFAQFLFEEGRKQEASELWEQSRAANQLENDLRLRVELLFNGFAHLTGRQSSDCLKQLKIALMEGARSEGWDFSRSIQQAVKTPGHPPNAWLIKLAAVCNNTAPLESLNKWKAWREV